MRNSRSIDPPPAASAARATRSRLSSSGCTIACKSAIERLEAESGSPSNSNIDRDQVDAPALQVPVPEAAAAAGQRQFDMRALQRLSDGARTRSHRVNAKCADRAAERKPGGGEQRNHDAGGRPPRREQVIDRRGDCDLARGRRDIAHRRKNFFSLARSDPHRSGFVGQDSERRRRTQQSGEGEFPCKSPRLPRDDQPGWIRQQRFAADQARIGRQNLAQRLRGRRGRRGGECGVEAASELARSHIELEGSDLQGARSLRAQVLPGQVREENEKETRGHRPGDARPRSRQLPKAERPAREIGASSTTRGFRVGESPSGACVRVMPNSQFNLGDIGDPPHAPNRPIRISAQIFVQSLMRCRRDNFREEIRPESQVFTGLRPARIQTGIRARTDRIKARTTPSPLAGEGGPKRRMSPSVHADRDPISPSSSAREISPGLCSAVWMLK